MTMDLISRKSVAKKMLYRRDYVGRPSDPDCIIADEPSIPAVPLDDLCDWLDERYEREICIRYNKRDTAGDKVPRSNEQFDLQLEMVA